MPSEPKRRGRKAREAWQRERRRRIAYGALSDAAGQLVRDEDVLDRWITAAKTLLERLPLECLSDLERKVLRRLHELEAFSARQRQASKTIARVARTLSAQAGRIRHALADLRTAGLVETAGRGGAAGYWLTPRGVELARALLHTS